MQSGFLAHANKRKIDSRSCTILGGISCLRSFLLLFFSVLPGWLRRRRQLFNTLAQSPLIPLTTRKFLPTGIRNLESTFILTEAVTMASSKLPQVHFILLSIPSELMLLKRVHRAS